MIAYPPERKNPTAARILAFTFVALLGLLTLSAHAQTSGSVTLAWNPDTASGLAGYRLYQGVSSGSYTNQLTLGNTTNATVSGLAMGVNYFFALTAYTTNGLESPFSNEITYTPATNAALPAVILTAPANGTTYTAPASINLAASVTTNGHVINKVQFFNGSSLLAEDTAPPYVFAWSNIGAGSYALTSKVVYDSTNTLTSAAVNVTVTGTITPAFSLSFASTSGVIASPFVASNGIVSQAVSTSVTNGGRAAYSFNIGTAGNYLVSAVTVAPSPSANSFYVNIDAEPTDPTMIWDVPITTTPTQTTVSWRGTGTDTNDQFSPKIFTLSQGTHQLIVRGREANTQLGNITISPTNSTTPPVSTTAPVVVMTAPNNNSTYAAPANLSLAATVTPNGHSISKVQFFNGATLLGESLTAPYSLSWNNVGAGNYNLSATAIYDAGSTVSSSSVNVSVTNPAPSNPNITFAASSGTISSPFLVSSGIIFQTTTTGTSGGGRAVYTFSVPTTGDYLISAQVNAPNTLANSFYVNIDANPTDPVMIWDTAVTTGFSSQTVSWRGNINPNGVPGADQFTPKVFNLTQGTHQLIILGREGNTQLGAITISPATALPPPWQVVDIGNVGITGQASVSNGVYSVSGAGNLSGSSDNFRFLYQSMTGDGDLRARINSLQNSATNACAGVIIRETLTPGSKCAFVGISPDGTVRAQSRISTATGSSALTSGSLTVPNAWARLVRSNNAVLGYKSTDGAAWSLVSSNSIAMATNIYFGLAVASGTTNAPTTATFTNVVAIP
jgi:hypothetical protein